MKFQKNPDGFYRHFTEGRCTFLSQCYCSLSIQTENTFYDSPAAYYQFVRPSNLKELILKKTKLYNQYININFNKIYFLNNFSWILPRNYCSTIEVKKNSLFLSEKILLWVENFIFLRTLLKWRSRLFTYPPTERKLRGAFARVFRLSLIFENLDRSLKLSLPKVCQLRLTFSARFVCSLLIRFP